MGEFQYHIVPYSPKYEQALLQLERNAVQGRLIQLEMLRDSYLSRSEIFEKHQAFVSLDENGQVMGVLAAAITPIWQNGVQKQVGVCFDVRVDPLFRGHGLTKKMGVHANEVFYQKHEVEGLFLTLKAGNDAVYQSAKILGMELYLYPFVYLTIPTWQRVGRRKATSQEQRFQVRLTPNPAQEGGFYQHFGGGLGVWQTHRMYRLRIRKLHPLLKWGQRLLNFLRKKDRQLPSEGDELRFASLFGCVPENAGGLDEVLAYLQTRGIGYLSVCCAEGDFLYDLFKPLSINAYPYLLLSTFPTKPEDKIGMDVRCL